MLGRYCVGGLLSYCVILLVLYANKIGILKIPTNQPTNPIKPIAIANRNWEVTRSALPPKSLSALQEFVPNALICHSEERGISHFTVREIPRSSE